MLGWRSACFGDDLAATSSAPVYRRELLRSGNEITGPAIIEQLDATTIVPAQGHVTVDAFANLIMQLPDQPRAGAECVGGGAWVA